MRFNLVQWMQMRACAVRDGLTVEQWVKAGIASQLVCYLEVLADEADSLFDKPAPAPSSLPS